MADSHPENSDQDENTAQMKRKAEIEAFEKKYNVSLLPAYKAYIELHGYDGVGYGPDQDMIPFKVLEPIPITIYSIAVGVVIGDTSRSGRVRHGQKTLQRLG